MATTSLTNTNISDTYPGVLHAKGEPIPASGLQYVYDGFGNKSSLKIGQAGEGIDIDGDLGSSFINTLYPVGAVIFSADNTNPGVRFTGTTWTQRASGRFIAGVGTGNDGTNTQAVPAGNDSTGKYKHTLTEAELPAHTHTQAGGGGDDDGGPYVPGGTNPGVAMTNISTTGGGQAHNNTPPSFGLYVWERTA